MEAANILETNTIAFNHRDWSFIPDSITPNCFSMEENRTGKILGTIILPESGDNTFLNLIGCAPELEDIAEMFRDHMEGSPMERTMVFSLVMDVLHRICKQ